VTWKQAKFVIASGVIILAVIYLAYSGYQESRMYCYSVPRVFALKNAAYGVRLQVAGIVTPMSIERHAGVVDFVIGQSPQTLHIRYIGKDSQDRLIEDAVALATGTLGKDGIFVSDILLVRFSHRFLCIRFTDSSKLGKSFASGLGRVRFHRNRCAPGRGTCQSSTRS
jgi:cytochrome c-type biogenesis protein CcmE